VCVGLLCVCVGCVCVCGFIQNRAFGCLLMRYRGQFPETLISIATMRPMTSIFGGYSSHIWVYIFLVLCCGWFLRYGEATCPNSCYHRGTCTTSSTCECDPKYTGPDCSLSKGSLSSASMFVILGLMERMRLCEQGNVQLVWRGRVKPMHCVKITQQ
jgi:hypothetical protein